MDSAGLGQRPVVNMLMNIPVLYKVKARSRLDSLITIIFSKRYKFPLFEEHGGSEQ
jgi:hypothetical protein